jgi:hypothetical protein
VDILDGSGANNAPNANAGPGQIVARGTRVTLNGDNSNDPDGDSLTYAWSQTLGPAVTLTNANTSSASFTAPSISSDTLLTFQLAVTDPDGLSDSAIVAITVRTNPRSSGSGGSVSLWLLALLLLERMRFYYRLFAIRSR